MTIESDLDEYEIVRNGRTFTVTADQMLVDGDIVTFLADGIFQFAVRKPDWVLRRGGSASVVSPSVPHNGIHDAAHKTFIGQLRQDDVVMSPRLGDAAYGKSWDVT